MATNTPNYNLSVPENTDTMEDTVQAYRNNLEIIDNNLGGGGGGNADVVHLTQEEYDALPASKTSDHKIYMIEDTFSEGELGRINVNGMFIDTTNVLGSGTWLSPFSYTAVQDCFVYLDGDLDNSHFVVNINGVKIYDIGSSSYVEQMLLFPLKKGQTLTATRTTNYSLNYAIYGIQPASNVVIIPDYLSSCYSTSERQIGCYRDGKPLYQKTLVLRENGVDLYTYSGNSYLNCLPNDIEFINIVQMFMPRSGGDAGYVDVRNNYNEVQVVPNISNRSIYLYDSHNPTNTVVTIQYTKTTDVAGSGEWTPHGTPTVHYSTEETCIGTWIDGKPIYEITVEFSSAITVNSGTWANTSIPTTDKKAILNVVGINPTGTCWNFLSANCDTGSYVQVLHARGAAITLKTLTIQYTKTTD